MVFTAAAPAILGMDFAGTVETVGEGVEEFSVGDEVYGCAGGLADLPGTLAEYIVADTDLVAPEPKTLSMREAAALPLVVITASEGLRRAGIQQRHKVGMSHLLLKVVMASLFKRVSSLR